MGRRLPGRCRTDFVIVLLVLELVLALCWSLLQQGRQIGVAAQALGSGSSSSGLSAAGASSSSDASSRSGASSGGYSALCVVGKNENRYVREWVEYHKCLGFSRIYLYDHNSTVPMWGDLQEHIFSGFVSYTNFSAAHTKFKDGYTSDIDRFMATVQGQAYKDCVDRFGSSHTFLGFIDIDEFLVVNDKSIRNVDELLRDYERFPGLSIYWILLGSSGHVMRPAANVVDSYTACLPQNHNFNTQFKTFVNTRFKPTMYSPHRAIFDAPPDPVTGLPPYMVDERFNRIQRGRNKNSVHVRAAVFHYVIKSLEDFKEKIKRGGGAGVTRPRYFFDLTNRHSKATCHEAIETRSRFCGLATGGGGSRAGGDNGSRRQRSRRGGGGIGVGG